MGPAPEGSPDELFLCLRVVALPNGKSGGIKIGEELALHNTLLSTIGWALGAAWGWHARTG